MTPLQQLQEALPLTRSSEASMHIGVALAHRLLDALPDGPVRDELDAVTPRLTTPYELLIINTVLAKSIIIELGGEVLGPPHLTNQ